MLFILSCIYLTASRAQWANVIKEISLCITKTMMFKMNTHINIELLTREEKEKGKKWGERGGGGKE